MDNYSAKQNVVEAIEDGKIIKTTEEYALREGLPILRKQEISFLGNPNRKAALEIEKKEMKRAISFDTFRRPLRHKPNDVASTLVDNFHWQISQKRRQNNLTRKQLADKTGVKEIDIKMIENGVLPSDDYILINKLQQLFGINLRKDGKDFSSSAISKLDGKEESIKRKAVVKEESSDKSKDKSNEEEPISGEDIEIELED